ncbi:MAG: hypothetical protein DCC75_10520 [Proteobacteria bacterium]|nr:MAG: hypothetical protein DCC75_10520 [Pseudomonadota bacterium]
MVQRKWFVNTSSDIRQTLAELPEQDPRNFNGFLLDLAERPERIANVTVESLAELVCGNYAVIPVFNVRSDAGQLYTYEYVSWRYGSMSGVKGLILLENHERITHFIVLKGEKFATGKVEDDSVGGYIDLNVDGVTNLSQRIEKEIQQELGLPELVLKGDTILLGEMATDPGMTNNRPGLFIAILDVSLARQLESAARDPDERELRGEVCVYPIGRLQEVVRQSQDSFFLACVAKGWARGIFDGIFR